MGSITFDAVNISEVFYSVLITSPEATHTLQALPSPHEVVVELTEGVAYTVKIRTPVTGDTQGLLTTYTVEGHETINMTAQTLEQL